MPTNDSSELPCDFVAYLSLRHGIEPEEALSVLGKMLQAYEPQRRPQIECLAALDRPQPARTPAKHRLRHSPLARRAPRRCLERLESDMATRGQLPP